MYNCCNLKKKILHISRYEYPFFLSKNNVLGVGLGQKIIHGFNTLKPCITVFVQRKLSLNKILMKDLVPSMYKGIPTDVVETGNITPSSLKSRIRPTPCGYSIGLGKKVPGGTLGCLVADARFNYVLSCNHVLAKNTSEYIGDPIVQPSSKYGGRAPGDTIANLSTFINLKTDSENVVDCAIARVSDNSCVSKNIALLNSPIKGVSDAIIGMDVQKVGYYTEKTMGKITVLGLTIDITLWGKTFFFVNQICTTKMDHKGDSGSILLDMNMNAIGLLVGSTTQCTVYNPIRKVLNKLNVEIITG